MKLLINYKNIGNCFECKLQACIHEKEFCDEPIQAVVKFMNPLLTEENRQEIMETLFCMGTEEGFFSLSRNPIYDMGGFRYSTTLLLSEKGKKKLFEMPFSKRYPCFVREAKSLFKRLFELAHSYQECVKREELEFLF